MTKAANDVNFAVKSGPRPARRAKHGNSHQLSPLSQAILALKPGEWIEFADGSEATRKIVGQRVTYVRCRLGRRDYGWYLSESGHYVIYREDAARTREEVEARRQLGTMGKAVCK